MKMKDLCSEIVSNDKAFRDYVESQKAWTPSQTVSREQAISQISRSAKVKKRSVFIDLPSNLLGQIDENTSFLHLGTARNLADRLLSGDSL